MFLFLTDLYITNKIIIKTATAKTITAKISQSGADKTIFFDMPPLQQHCNKHMRLRKNQEKQVAIFAFFLKQNLSKNSKLSAR